MISPGAFSNLTGGDRSAPVYGIQEPEIDPDPDTDRDTEATANRERYWDRKNSEERYDSREIFFSVSRMAIQAPCIALIQNYLPGPVAGKRGGVLALF
jgi:hypothetical protein